MKIRQVLRLGDHAGQLAQRLRHQPRLQADVAVAHLAVEFGLGHQRGHRIDHQHVDGARAHQRFGDLQRLLAVVGLRDQQVVDIHAQLLGVGGIERVLGVDEGRHAALLLRLGDHLQRDGGLARRLRPEDLHHAAARESAHAQRGVEARWSPVEITAIGTTASLDPSRMMEPLPNCFSICEMATSTARFFSVLSSAMIFAAPWRSSSAL